MVNAYNIRQERPGFGILQNDMTFLDDYIYFSGEFFNHTTLSDEQYISDPYIMKFD